jgi:hypothetical protein
MPPNHAVRKLRKPAQNYWMQPGEPAAVFTMNQGGLILEVDGWRTSAGWPGAGSVPRSLSCHFQASGKLYSCEPQNGKDALVCYNR